ncbi:MAG: proprotein convertase P-domain-containing protein, partial [Caldilineales bacterium]
MQRKYILHILAVIALLVLMLPTAVAAQVSTPPQSQPGPFQFDLTKPLGDTASGKTITEASSVDGLVSIAGMNMFSEVEPNGTSATATALPGNNTVAVGNVYPNGDLDYFSFTGNAGDRVYAATMTSFSASSSTDSFLTLFASDGSTVIESDNDDGSFGTTASTIAGATLPSAGTYYLQVRHNSATSQLRPYYLYLRVQSGSPTPESESNDTPATANALPANGWVSGARDPAAATEQDWFSFTANAGDTVYLNLDLDPERDNVQWNGRLGIALFGDAGNQILVANDGSTGSATNPLSEAMFMTIKTGGTYYAFVDSATATVGGPTATYHLSVTIYPANPEGINCTTYTSTDVPVTIPTVTGMVQSTLTVPGNPVIADIDVSIQLTHTWMQDLDVHLVSPAGNDNGLFTDVGSGTLTNPQIQMDVTWDDEAAIPPAFTAMKGMNYKPELSYRLSWFDHEKAGGTWTLKLYDDASGDGGVLQGWSITICEPPPPPVCPAGYAPVTLYSSDFEAGDDGFTHSGTEDEWARGTPTAAPITTCNSGSSCWKTDLAGTYNVSSSQDLLSPAIDLTDISGPITLNWAQRYQMESASFDHAYVQVQQAGGANPTKLWEWLDATMTNLVGSPSTTIQESAGWGEWSADISSYAGQSIEALFHLDSDTTVQYAGLAIDDVSVTGCELVPVAGVEITKTVDGPSAVTLPDGTGTISFTVSYTNTSPTMSDEVMTFDDTGTISAGIVSCSVPISGTVDADSSDSQIVTCDVDITPALCDPITVVLTNTVTVTATTIPDDDSMTASATAAAVTITVPASDPTNPQCNPVVPDPAIVMTKTVGTVPGVCATTSKVTVPSGTTVYYCYQVENSGNVTMTVHSLVDDQLGTLLTNSAYVLPPGAVSDPFIVNASIDITTTNTATWTAVSALGGYTVNTGAPYNYISIQTSGAALALGDDGEANITLPFPFTFFGVTSSNLRVGNNGGILFNTAAGDLSFTNAALPTASPAYAIFPFWDDIDSDTGDVYWQVQGVAPNRMAIIEWYNRPHYSNIGAATFEVILYETTNQIKFQYADVDFGDPLYNNGASATVGINKDASTAVQVSFNTPSLSAQQAILFSPATVYTASDSDTAEVNVLYPQIMVDPEYVALKLFPDETTTRPLNISNVGGAPLTWMIEEENLPAPTGQVNTGTAGNPLFAAERVDASDFKPGEGGVAAPLGNWQAPAALLYDNGPLVTHPGGGAGGADASALQDAILGTYGFGHAVSSGFRVADDFTVPAGGWNISQITFFAYQTGSTTTSTINAVNLRIWDGVPGQPGSNVVFGDTTTNRLASSTWSNDYRVLQTALTGNTRPIMADVVTVNMMLPAGTYWLDWQTGGTLASGPWAPPVSILGQTGKPGANAMQFDGAAWVPVEDTGASGTAAYPQDFPFLVEGTPAVAGNCQLPSDIPWLTVSPLNGVTAPGATTPVTLGFDATGLTPGVYTGNLCISSDDPDMGPGNGTDFVIVPVTLTVSMPLEPSIIVTKTVGTVPGVCATESSILVAAGTTVYYCYTVTNTGNVIFTTHDLYDDQLGQIFSGLAYVLNPGASVNTVTAGLSVPAVINTPTTNTATWTAAVVGGPSASATATAFVDVYAFSCEYPIENFEAGVPPLGWSVVNNV